MLRIISWIIGLPVLIAVITFAVSNRQVVDLSLWPTSIEFQLSIATTIIIAMFLGYILGAFFTWAFSGKTRRELRKEKKGHKIAEKDKEKLEKENQELTKKIEELKALYQQEEKNEFLAKISGLFSK